MFKNILVTGGAGYCGSLLVPQLLDAGYNVTVYDLMYFGDSFLPRDNPRLKVISGDIRDTSKLAVALRGQEAVLSLACISNDASFELDERLSTTINLDAFEPMVIAAKKAVTEDHPLVPLTLYNKYKGMCEPLLLKHTDDNFVGVIFRPATVCGYAPRLRLDLSVNILTNHAVTNNKITVFGGSQLRPNLHVQDYADLCKLLLTAPSGKIANQIFNCGYQNMTIMEIARMVKKVVEQEFPEKPTIEIVTTPTDDNRSYHINSDKIKNVLGFTPKYTIEEAVRDLCRAFRQGKIVNSFADDRFYNVRTLKKLKAA
jgi:nucleoside-diphosphate-sugar epimerase